jgi:hypothetical protein
MRKLLLTFTAMLFCSIASFAQTISIGSVEDFMKIGKVDTHPANGSYELTANINLGTYASDNNFVIESFSGTFDGGDNTITYNGSFVASSNQKIGLFKIVSANGTGDEVGNTLR